MKQKRKAKKGVTLIEAIISVALLAILIIPLSNLVWAAFKTNKDGETKQKASFVGQKLLEEMEAYDELKLENDGTNKFFKLLDGDKVTEFTAGTNRYSGSFHRINLGSDFKVELTVVKDVNFSFDSKNANNVYALTYKLSKDIAPGTQEYISQGTEKKLFSSDNLVLNIDAFNKVNISSLFTVPSVAPPLDKGISIELDSTFDTNLNLNVDSAIAGTTQIYIIKDEASKGNVNVTAVSGNIKVNRYMNVSGGENIADLYNIDVKVYKGNTTETLFQGSTKKNIRFK